MTPEEFQAYDASRPEIWHWFQHYTEVKWREGFRRYSQDGIMHLVRAHCRFPILNASVAGYARKWQSQNPTRARFFLTKPSMVDMGPVESPQAELFA